MTSLCSATTKLSQRRRTRLLKMAQVTSAAASRLLDAKVGTVYGCQMQQRSCVRPLAATNRSTVCNSWTTVAFVRLDLALLLLIHCDWQPLDETARSCLHRVLLAYDTPKHKSMFGFLSTINHPHLTSPHLT